MRVPNPPGVLRHSHSVSSFLEALPAGSRLLNVGSSSVRLTPDSVNLDVVRKPGVDVQADAHHLPFAGGSFDAVVLSAVLQYCRRPDHVVAEVARVLRPGGRVYVDAPFVQPYCADGPDMWRFTRTGLRELFGGAFEVEEVGASIPTGPALAFVARRAAERAENRYVRYAAKWAVTLAALPLTLWMYQHPDVAGALYLVGVRA